MLLKFDGYFYVRVLSCLLYPVAEKGRKYDGCADDEQAGPNERHDRFGHSVLAHVHLDVYLHGGNDGHDGGDGVAQVQDIQQVLYFTCNSIDNQIYIDFENYKCSQNETRIVLPISMRNGCVQLLQNRMKSAIKAHCVVKHILMV